VSPRRVLLVLAVFALAIAIGAGLAYLLQILRPVFWSVRTLTENTGATVLGAVSGAFPQVLRRRKRWEFACFTLASTSFVLLAVTVLGFSLMDVHLQIPFAIEGWL
jgi:hypothetical protein